jgi:hypothetical protein
MTFKIFHIHCMYRDGNDSEPIGTFSSIDEFLKGVFPDMEIEYVDKHQVHSEETYYIYEKEINEIIDFKDHIICFNTEICKYENGKAKVKIYKY